MKDDDTVTDSNLDKILSQGSLPVKGMVTHPIIKKLTYMFHLPYSAIYLFGLYSCECSVLEMEPDGTWLVLIKLCAPQEWKCSNHDV